MILALALAPEKRAALERLLVEQQDPGSPNFHRWLTPDEFGAHFGATPDEIALETGWLQSHGFAVDEVGRGSGTWINFTGTVADVEAAFRTQIHDYVVAGDVHHANAADPSIPGALADLVVGVVSLHDFRPEPASHLSLPGTNLASGEHWLSPGDLATIYNVNPLYSAGINGSGQSIAVIARTNLNLSDVQYFRSLFNLPSNDPQFIINGTDPGIISSSEESEADLDVEWSGAVAPNATIKVVITKLTNATSGEILWGQYIVNNNVAPVTTMSFYLCESSLGTSWNQFYNTMWSQAAAQGISVFVCSGDSGGGRMRFGFRRIGHPRTGRQRILHHTVLRVRGRHPVHGYRQPEPVLVRVQQLHHPGIRALLYSRAGVERERGGCELSFGRHLPAALVDRGRRLDGLCQARVAGGARCPE